MKIIGSQKFIITVINSVSDTSMPFNEFVLYRHNIRPNDRQLVIVCGKSVADNVRVPQDLEVHYVGHSRREILNIIEQVKKECQISNLKLIIHLHQPKSAMIFNLNTLFKGLRKSTIFTVHSLFNAYNIPNKIISFITSLYVQKVTCVSETSYNNYPKLVKRLKKDNMSVIRNGVNLNRIDTILTTSQHNTSEKITLIYVARMIPIKNHKFLIELVSKMKDCKLVLIGAEDKDGEIRKMIESKGIKDRVEMLGLISRNAVFEKLNQANIYVSPSLVEGLPVSVLEAMYVGLPVILSDIEPHLEIKGSNKEIITHPLIETKWINSIIELSRKGKNHLNTIGENNKQHAQQFSLDKMLDNFNKLYEEM